MKRFLITCFLLVLLLVSCRDSRRATRNNYVQEFQQTDYSMQNTEYLNTVYDYSDASQKDNTGAEPAQEQSINDKVKSEPILPSTYEEGYDNGYDDGEEDALSDRYQGSYDDWCKYTGKEKEEYELGYLEGYEAGYYDNVEDE